MRLVVVGSAGMLGQDVVGASARAGIDVTACSRSDLDVTDPAAVDRVVDGHDVVVNCAAWTAVDDAETQEAAAFAVNATGASNLARGARRAGARLVHLSTDYVFAGDASAPYDEHCPLAPRSAYGRTKAAGEWAVRAECPDHLVVRTAWLYGAGGACFPTTIARLARERDRVDVVDDEIGQPTWTVDVADLLVRMLVAGVPAGTYHATSSGRTSWYDFARAVVAEDGGDVGRIHRTTSAAFARPAPRPSYSVLGHEALRRLGVEPIGPWHQRWQAAAPSVLAAGQQAQRPRSSTSSR